ncbi:hypothetical protein [Roseateles sp. P5_E7]
MRTIAALVALTISAALVGCDVACGNEPIADATSPGGDLRAVVFSRNCGATTGFNTQISIVRTGDPVPDGGGNTFIADGTVPLKLQWTSEAELVVSGALGSKAFKQERHVNGVLISYR